MTTETDKAKEKTLKETVEIYLAFIGFLFIIIILIPLLQIIHHVSDGIKNFSGRCIAILRKKYQEYRRRFGFKSLQ